MSEISIYVHIPFCVKKCDYCDFLSQAVTKGVKKRYIDALCREIKSQKTSDEVVRTIFIGGGTPSVLESKEMGAVMQAIRQTFSISKEAEITIECNPGTLTEEKADTYQKLGINRISFGLQSANNEELKSLGRIHTWETFQESYELARKKGFRNINVDLMSALPGQTFKSWCETLKAVLQLYPEHISAYSLIIEEGTPFFSKYGEDARRRDRGDDPQFLPSEEAERAMYQETEHLLDIYGYRRYEISNYARQGYECRHNLVYWEREPYLGFGLGASSCMNEVRFSNVTDMEEYLRRIRDHLSPVEKESCLTVKEQMEETMFLGLRKIKGVSRKVFFQRFHCEIEEIYGEVMEKLIQEGLLEENEQFVHLTRRGIDVSNTVMAEFLL